MNTTASIITHAERVFDHRGFAATGVDQLTQSIGVSSRTLYKHVGSKTALIAAVLEARCARFVSQFEVDSIDALFVALESWTRAEGARGCLFLRAQGEAIGDTPEIAKVITRYRHRLRACIEQVVANEIGPAGNSTLAEQILVLFEGATSAASYRGTQAISAARVAAATLLEQTRHIPHC